MHARVVLGVEKVSCLERCPQFRSVLIERGSTYLPSPSLPPQLLEAYENEQYFQLVMEKHGDGLDLFEFIEQCPKVTEPLISHMFRQVVAGLSYLHGKNILHRDVKVGGGLLPR